jgi:recombination associated protein RdgC
MAFSKIATTLVWVSPQDNLLVLDCGSNARADEVMTALVKAVGGLAVALINTQTSPTAAMAHWLREREAPQGFSVDRECELKAADESKSVVRYTRHALDTDEVVQHVTQGKLPTRLALTWNERVSFVLSESLQLKKLAILDVVLEENSGAAGDGKDDSFDADIAIATGELAPLLDDLLEALGGEAPLGAALQ